MKLNFQLDKWDGILLISMIIIIGIFIIPGLNAGYNDYIRSLLAFWLDMIVALPIVIINVRFLMPYFFVKHRVWWYFPVLVLIIAPLIFEYNLLVKLFYSYNTEILNNHGYKLERIGLFIWSMLRHITIMSLALIVRRLVFARQNIAELESEKRLIELNLLKSQLNPHFYFNTLNNLYALSLKKSEQTPMMILRLSQMMEFIIYDCSKEFISLEKEVGFLENYIELEKIRYENGFKIEFTVNGNINGIKIIPMIFIQFVENAFKHGDIGSENSFIIIRLQANEDCIEFFCENTYKSKSNNQGIGLINLKKRLDSYYQNKYDFKINEQNGIFKVYLKLDDAEI